jgi:hypothetical protein
MPVEMTITESDPTFFDALREPAKFMPILAESMKNIIEIYEERASVYAPESEANHPGRFSLVNHLPMGFYERGRGWWYPIMRQHTLGFGGVQTIQPTMKAPKTKEITALRAVGMEIQGVVGYHLRETSEQMGDRWSTEVQQQSDAVLGMLSNTASYSGLVQGLMQAKLHRTRDWKTVIDTWEGDAMQMTVTDETMKAIDQFYHL